MILTVGSNNSITSSQVLKDLKSNQTENKTNKIEMWISKRNESHIITHIQERWETFNQMSMVQNKVVDIDAIDIQSVKINMDNSIYSTHRKYNNSGYKIIRMKYNDETKI